jgi:iron-sulfur cluster assembly accessory protein
MIHKEMRIQEIFSTYPQKSQTLAQIMTDTGLHCVGCSASTWETLEAGTLGHGMSQLDLESLISRLNDVIEEKQVNPNTITLTERAALKYLQILEQEKKQGWGLRLNEKLSGCNGYEYTLDFSEKATSDDDTFICHEIEIFVKKNSTERLLGSEIDYVDSLTNGGFKVSNPNVKSSCSCGTSHGY